MDDNMEGVPVEEEEDENGVVIPKDDEEEIPGEEM